MTPVAPADDNVDDQVDLAVAECLNLDRPKSFFVFAGAGSGKTRSLVTALGKIRLSSGSRMRQLGQRVAVITYTNAACDEVTSRLGFDALFSVSTIHSFVWSLIDGFNHDIRAWLTGNLAEEITELKVKEAKGRAGKASDERRRSIESKQRRLEALPGIKRFVYSPAGENNTRDSLNHAEVLKSGASFLTHKPLLREILIGRFPILLIDESQDTNGGLLDALMAVQAANKERFVLGLFGDMMQRIYSDGKIDLGEQLPEDWEAPVKTMNHRSPKRVVTLINRVRSAADNLSQKARSDAIEGHVRLFLSRGERNDKSQVEARVRERMAAITDDAKWITAAEVKTLTLEHHMAATRMTKLRCHRSEDVRELHRGP